jgi:hypothetical protein
MLPARIPKKPKRASRWRSIAHSNHVRGFACAMCGSMTNVVAAHVKLGAHTGTGQKGDDFLTVPLCDGPFSNIDGELGCHNRQHIIGERSFWNEYQQRHDQSVEKLLGELCGTSPKRHEIEAVMKERANG